MKHQPDLSVAKHVLDPRFKVVGNLIETLNEREKMIRQDVTQLYDIIDNYISGNNST